MNEKEKTVYVVLSDILTYFIPYSDREEIIRLYMDITGLGKNSKTCITKIKETHLQRLAEKCKKEIYPIDCYIGDLYMTEEEMEIIENCMEGDADLLFETCKTLKKLLKVCKGESANNLKKALKIFMNDTSDSNIEEYEIDDYDTSQLLYCKLDIELYAKKYFKYTYSNKK